MEILVLTLLCWLVMYFIVNRRKVLPEQRIDLGTDLDRKTPFLPQFAPIYFSTYFFVIQPFLFLGARVWLYWLLLLSHYQRTLKNPYSFGACRLNLHRT